MGWSSRTPLALNTLQETPYVINEYIVDAVDWVASVDKQEGDRRFPPSRRRSNPRRKRTRQSHHAEEAAAVLASTQEGEGSQPSGSKPTGRSCDAPSTWRVALPSGRFYLPHNWDTRGRIYHVPDFGHHNTDHMRAMLMLANKTRGEDGVSPG